MVNVYSVASDLLPLFLLFPTPLKVSTLHVIWPLAQLRYFTTRTDRGIKLLSVIDKNLAPGVRNPHLAQGAFVQERCLESFKMLDLEFC